ncbi:putative mitochondrial hypothetical protein [Leptomonas pyrrhocoris]|uniref:tRNA/rRNA methyltransferase SpoU type domain-containing protein n=1 Tax=Leptomonas pyrrhocoris TaxID=157538 RepID=A0A0N0VH79_LEPPY|nr:putative mitochondrial hypothetical protein [Leptomonas pyrrhocoris]XP_015663162.1 putative mitochondrial hypothetical protein [Leptomonas pyrrhocoris]XP_015663163.1 putative mitochondrial hypothetical protein [Leptomonas pyrrhocoris]KPA84722.1 putative mitochondrial hypothetical protein [Leptomonas pyrrhocoris]KPA84723.1 putative mitochondrial hypothetical protein [Leptomonas pyrrhocoris]KPA84724.1 putative mitochondrial hypothetical protein [Leptomonas pyrrhocoris]|eukprot:XP_015663161.1 putative mitochondrial hypothetical protein [Leptomonas pyrrhocoris]
MHRALLLLKQTLHPPRRTVPLAANPLTRWSRRIPQWRKLAGILTPVAVGLEGCHSAFNATNSIRTCLYFQTASPPAFLTADSWRLIEHVQTRCGTRDGLHTSSLSSSSSTTESARDTVEDDPFEGIASFGEDVFFGDRSAATGGENKRGDLPLVALENFTDRAQSLLHTRLPPALHDAPLRLVVGHENWGVRRSLLRPRERSSDATENADPLVADVVVYVPQYGTISSLNVVTSLGILLFYAFIDVHCPHSRPIYSATAVRHDSTSHHLLPNDTNSSEGELEVLRSQIQAYQDFFKKSLPTPSSSTQIHNSAATSDRSPPDSADLPSHDVHVNTTPRVDRRPIHPVFYQQDMNDIQQLQQSYRRMLLQFSGSTSPPVDGSTVAAVAQQTSPSFFGLSVLYENECDQRNFGGLLRNANAFLVDHVFYVGRRKYNVVGAVGSYHYTPPLYLGPLPDAASERGIAAARRPTSTADSDNVCCNDGDVAAAGKGWSASLKAKVDAMFLAKDRAALPPREWWLLDCGHRFLYDEAPTTTTDDAKRQSFGTANDAASGAAATKLCGSSPQSLQLYNALFLQGRVHSLCEAEAVLRDALCGGVVLVVPQEGKLPHAELMRLCNGVLTVLPTGSHYAELTALTAHNVEEPLIHPGHRGLPSQVASGIALQRLSAVLHPRLAAI